MAPPLATSSLKNRPDPVGFSWISLSCQFLLEIVRIRGAVEGLNVEPNINALTQKIATSAAKVPGVRPPVPPP